MVLKVDRIILCKEITLKFHRKIFNRNLMLESFDWLRYNPFWENYCIKHKCYFEEFILWVKTIIFWPKTKQTNKQKNQTKPKQNKKLLLRMIGQNSPQTKHLFFWIWIWSCRDAWKPLESLRKASFFSRFHHAFN